MAPLLVDLAPNAPLSMNAERGNLDIRFAGAATAAAPILSDRWEVAGRWIQFAQLAPHGTLGLPQGNGRNFVKVVTGALEGPRRRPFCEPRGLQDTTVRDTEIKAGPDGALVAIIRETANAPKVIHSMDQLGFSGPLAEALQWQTFQDRYGKFTNVFNDADAYIGPGFHLIDEEGGEIVFVNLWTAGKGVDLSTHNHGQTPSPRAPAFAEVHLTISNGTGKGGMYECDRPGASDRDRFLIQAGMEHGPFFVFDPETGAPETMENGALIYPWHGWEAGTDDVPGQAYDFVAAFETAPRYANVLR